MGLAENGLINIHLARHKTVHTNTLVCVLNVCLINVWFDFRFGESRIHQSLAVFVVAQERVAKSLLV